jgi:hypothetical protein
MKETPEHIEIFELYYAMGNSRSLEKLLKKLHQDGTKTAPSMRTLKRWSNEFNWQQRVEQRDIENSKALEDKLKPQTNKTIVNTKADYRAEIKTQLGILKAILNKSIEKIKARDIIDISNTNDLKDVINSYTKLCDMDLKLMGEATDIHEFRELDGNLNKLTDEELRKLADSNR